MGMEVGGAKRGIFVEINVVPLIDVLLVLLVIAMIVLPQVNQGLKAELPQPAPPGQEARVPSDPLVLEVLADGSLRINQQPVRWDVLQERLEQILGARANRIVFLRGDRALEFQVVARAIDIMNAAGVSSVGLMTPGLDQKFGAD
jgi:biopolymer transport protein TolR